MTTENHRIARDFFAALSSGTIPDDLVTDDLTVWTTTSGQQPPGKARYQGGIKFFMSIFPDGLHYTVDSLTAEEDRVAAEVQSNGTLVNGVVFHNIYIFMLRIRDGKICSVTEHFNPLPVQEKILPLLQAAMAKSAS